MFLGAIRDAIFPGGGTASYVQIDEACRCDQCLRQNEHRQHSAALGHDESQPDKQERREDDQVMQMDDPAGQDQQSATTEQACPGVEARLGVGGDRAGRSWKEEP